MIAAVHQPNFFPWLGYFAKMAKADLFVFLDAVQFPRSSRGTWINRVKVLVDGRSKWITCPIDRKKGVRQINACERIDIEFWSRKITAIIEHSYKKTPFFSSIFPAICDMIASTEIKIADYNIGNLTALKRMLGLKTKCMRQSEMKSSDVFQTRGSERLVAICRELDAETYLAGDGASEYERPEIYMRAGIKLKNNHFISQPYDQIASRDFIPGLSILDALFNIGLEATQKIINSDL